MRRLSLILALVLPLAAAAEEAGPAIQVSEVRPAALTGRVWASGLIAPVEEVLVQPLIEGQPIEALRADVGDTVAAGDVLAVLSKTTLELQKSQSLATLAAARAAIAQAAAQKIEAEAAAAEADRVAARTKQLREQGSASQAALDSATAGALAANARVELAREAGAAAEAQLALAEAQLANVELMLTRTEVKAPYGGRVTARNATLGAVASAQGQPMFVLEKDGALELRADLSEADLMRLEPGQKADLRLVGLKAPIAGRVRLIEPAIDPATRLGRARIELPATPGLRAGMFAEAAIITAEREALALPISAIGTTGGRETVLRVRETRVEQVTVTTGIRDGGLVEITSGLTAGDLVVTKAGSFLRDGDRITPVAALN
ncbi:efflux RND transporter periplasmic adaptor subunit [Pseudogemmobacter humi]|uniref:Macrolide export protein MacA n=1 Tax=Pseudogemmobacter humi TaxID=2483812 RepID=A0A3P5XDA6_9RHOB|nr:efflux RND transporter periplasmic adaptor subunit [Pseudogemmobacter humi]VDC32664.1 Macrolide export protein MacA [Pseudogemmobacter humi]